MASTPSKHDPTAARIGRWIGYAALLFVLLLVLSASALLINYTLSVLF